jgi:hypothetical protein
MKDLASFTRMLKAQAVLHVECQMFLSHLDLMIYKNTLQFGIRWERQQLKLTVDALSF